MKIKPKHIGILAVIIGVLIWLKNSENPVSSYFNSDTTLEQSDSLMRLKNASIDKLNFENDSIDKIIQNLDTFRNEGILRRNERLKRVDSIHSRDSLINMIDGDWFDYKPP